MKLALSLALAAAAVSGVAAVVGQQSCDFEEKYRWEPKKEVRVVNATGPNGPFCNPSAVAMLTQFAQDFGQMTSSDVMSHFKPINAHLTEAEMESPFFLQYPYLLDVDVLVLPGLYTNILRSENVTRDMKNWIAGGGRIVFTGGSDPWQYEAAQLFDLGGGYSAGFSFNGGVSAPDDRASPYYLHRGDVEDTPLCSDEWAPPVFPWIPGTSPFTDDFKVNGQPVPIVGNDREQTGFRFLYTGGPNSNFSVTGHLTTAFHYSPPNEEDFGDLVYIGYDYLPRDPQDEMWGSALMGYRNLMAVALWSEDKDDNMHGGGVCGPAIPGLHMVQDQAGNALMLTPHCGGNSHYLPGAPVEHCDMLRIRVPEGYPPHMQVEMYRVPFTNSPGPVVPGHMCGGGDHQGDGGEYY